VQCVGAPRLQRANPDCRVQRDIGANATQPRMGYNPSPESAAASTGRKEMRQPGHVTDAEGITAAFAVRGGNHQGGATQANRRC